MLEVNHTPSFSADTPLDHIIKKNLIRDTMVMMSPSQDEINIKEKLDRIKQREKYVKFKNGNENHTMERDRLIDELNEIRIKQELESRGTYEIIFPCKSETKMDRYKEYELWAVKQYQQSSTLSVASLPSAMDIRNKLKDNPKAKVVSKHIIK
jgi:tubulin polyglutamylase TTLL6/13